MRRVHHIQHTQQQQIQHSLMAKKKAVPAAAAAASAAAAGAAVVEEPSAAFTPAEAKKLAKLLKASDRGKRLDAIGVVSKNHGYIAKGGCLLPVLESMVVKKKTEEVVKAAAQVGRYRRHTSHVYVLFPTRVRK